MGTSLNLPILYLMLLSFPSVSTIQLKKDKDTNSTMRNRYKQIIRENHGYRRKNPIQDYE